MSKVLRHPDKEDIIARLISGDSVKEVDNWLKSKYPRKKRLHISYMTLQKFRSEHLNLRGEVLEDIKNKRSEVDKASAAAEAKMIIESSSAYQDKINEIASNEMDVTRRLLEIESLVNSRIKYYYDLLNNGSKFSLFNTSQGVIESPDKISKKNFKNKPSKNIGIGDGVFVLNENEISKINPNKEEKKLFKKYLNSNDVEKYQINFDNEYLIYSDNEISKKIKDKYYPNIENHLNKYKKFITSGNGPYGLHRPRNENFFLNPKIIFKNMFLKPAFTYDEEKFYVGISFIVIIQNSSLSLKFLLALLNSKFGFYWFIKNAKERGLAFDVTIEKINNFPIPKITERDKTSVNKIIKNVETLISNKKKKQSLIDEIDELIFKICDLKNDQIREINETISRFLTTYDKVK